MLVTIVKMNNTRLQQHTEQMYYLVVTTKLTRILFFTPDVFFELVVSNVSHVVGMLSGTTVQQ